MIALSARTATVAMPPTLAKVMSKLVATALVPFGANLRIICVDGALLHAKPVPTRTDDKTRRKMLSVLRASGNAAAMKNGAASMIMRIEGPSTKLRNRELSAEKVSHKTDKARPMLPAWTSLLDSHTGSRNK